VLYSYWRCWGRCITFTGGHSTPKGQAPLVSFSSDDLTPLKTAFNASASSTRVCRNAVAHLRLLFGRGPLQPNNWLQENNGANVRVFVVWEPVLGYRISPHLRPLRWRAFRCTSFPVLGSKTGFVSLVGRTQPLDRGMGLHRSVCARKHYGKTLCPSRFTLTARSATSWRSKGCH